MKRQKDQPPNLWIAPKNNYKISVSCGSSKHIRKPTLKESQRKLSDFPTNNTYVSRLSTKLTKFSSTFHKLLDLDNFESNLKSAILWKFRGKLWKPLDGAFLDNFTIRRHCVHSRMKIAGCIHWSKISHRFFQMENGTSKHWLNIGNSLGNRKNRKTRQPTYILLAFIHIYSTLKCFI